MKKCHRAVFQNAWSQKNQHSHWKNNSVSKKAYKFIWKKATEPSSKMPEAKKTNSLIEKNNSVPKKLVNSYEKRPRNRSSKMPEAKKPNTLIEKTILFRKRLYNGVRIHRIWSWESHYLHRIYFSNSGRYFLGKTNSAITSWKKHSTKPKSCQNLQKSIFQYFFN